MRTFSLPDKPFCDLIILALLLALLFGVSLGDRPYSAPSESRYIEIGREMAETGDFVTPRLNYVKYFEKPPLFYWIQAESTKLFGISPFAARIPTALFAVMLCLLTYGLGRMLYGRLAGWLGTLTLATSLYLFALSRIVLLDMPVSFFMDATLAAFIYTVYAPPGRMRTTVIYVMYIAAACAVLTKGLIGAILPGIVIFLWLVFTRRWQVLKEMRLISGTALFLLVAVPWHIIVAERNPEWAQFYFIHEHFQRYLTKEAGRYQPVWFFAAVLLAGFFPWVAFLYQAAKDGLKNFWHTRFEDGKQLFLVLWVAFILVFFSLSDSKLIPYILPVFPPLAVLLGRYFAAVWEEKPAPGFGIGLLGISLLLVLMAIAPTLLLEFLDRDNKITVALTQGGDELHTLSIASMIAAVLLLIVYVQGLKRHVIIAMLIVSAIILKLGDEVGEHYNKDSMFTFANIINAVHKPNDEVVMYQTYYQDMPVYVKQRIIIVDWKGELEFGAEHEDTSGWMINAASLWPRWLSDNHRMFMVMRDDAYERLTKEKSVENLHLYLLRQDGRNMLFMNRDPRQPEKEDRK